MPRLALMPIVVLLGCLLGTAVGAQDVAIPPPRDVAYEGLVELHVDVADVDRSIVRVVETVPVAQAGPLTLLYPRWLPGNHSTTGPIELLAGLQVESDRGERLGWRRDAEKMHAFHVQVPEDTASLKLRFEFISPTSIDQGRQVLTQDLLGLQWEKALLYPAGHYASRIRIQPALRLPEGWAYATALEGAQRSGDTVRFAPVSLEELVDSPVFAGPHYRLVELDANPRAPVRLNMFADRPQELEATPEQIELHRRMVRETLALFGARHYRHYDFLFAISSQFSSIGLEHLQSSENAVGLGYFLDWASSLPRRDLLAHEFVHSWNGKFRRPADLSAPSYDVPVRTSLLWVYEGMTEYWGVVLAARSGLWSEDYFRDSLAHYAASYDVGRAGRQWRNLQDTTQQPIINYRGAQSYPSWQRGKDYYTEGALIWLDVDTKLRELTRGRRSLDDFARAFFGESAPSTYTFEDVVTTLQSLAPHDWATYLRARLDGHGPRAPLEGLERAGWRLAYVEEPTASVRAVDALNHHDSFLFSIGLSLDRAGRIVEVYWGSPAFRAGIAPRMTVIAVDGRAYTARLLREAITAAKGDPQRRIDLLVRKGDRFETVSLDYHDGLRYPKLERIAGREDRLAAIVKPRALAARSAARP
jgi:predicted metalloprotease with PDZ domain